MAALVADKQIDVSVGKRLKIFFQKCLGNRGKGEAFLQTGMIEKFPGQTRLLIFRMGFGMLENMEKIAFDQRRIGIPSICLPLTAQQKQGPLHGKILRLLLFRLDQRFISFPDALFSSHAVTPIPFHFQYTISPAASQAFAHIMLQILFKFMWILQLYYAIIKIGILSDFGRQRAGHCFFQIDPGPGAVRHPF